MNHLFFCYDDPSALDKLIDIVHISTIGGYCSLVFLDWSYWKAAPYGVHSFSLHGIIFTFLFLRFCQSLDVKRMMRELSYPPRLIAAFLAGLNAIWLNLTLVSCSANYPGFLRWIYWLIAVIVIGAGYV